MERRWYGKDWELSARMFFVMFLLAALYLLFIAFLWKAGVGFLGMALIAGALLVVQFFFSDKIVLWSMGAREVDPHEAPELHAMIERLSQMADLPKPKVAIADSEVPNAFATGRGPKNSVVCVTTSLLRRLDPPELEAVLGHELTHVRNRDVMVITVAGFFAAVASFLVHNLLFSFGYLGDTSNDRDGEGMGIMAVWLVSMLVWGISFFLIRALSRYREYAADRGSAVLTGAPSQLASALVKISGVMERIPDRDLRKVEGMNAFFILPAMRRSSLMELLSTHPSLEKRLEQLKKLERDMERA
ncbi:MAG: zinc metalloprotease HtpX [Syntrophobacteraceae bacterium]|nr:zinc metalloprotease HtpX [Syntrophobacteraceae bacterium]